MGRRPQRDPARIGLAAFCQRPVLADRSRQRGAGPADAAPVRPRRQLAVNLVQRHLGHGGQGGRRLTPQTLQARPPLGLLRRQRVALGDPGGQRGRLREELRNGVSLLFRRAAEALGEEGVLEPFNRRLVVGGGPVLHQRPFRRPRHRKRRAHPGLIERLVAKQEASHGRIGGHLHARTRATLLPDLDPGFPEEPETGLKRKQAIGSRDRTRPGLRFRNAFGLRDPTPPPQKRGAQEGEGLGGREPPGT